MSRLGDLIDRAPRGALLRVVRERRWGVAPYLDRDGRRGLPGVLEDAIRDPFEQDYTTLRDPWVAQDGPREVLDAATRWTMLVRRLGPERAAAAVQRRAKRELGRRRSGNVS